MNPFKDQSKVTNAAKFKAITGKSAPGTASSDSSPTNATKKAMLGAYGKSDMKACGGAASGRMDRPGFKKGGRTKAIKIIINNNKSGAPPAGMPPEVLPPPPVAAGGPPMPPPGGPPMGGPPPGMPPMGKPPGMKSGGRLGMTAGTGSGEGRLQRDDKYGLKPK
jgi:hypothetical protein